MSNLPTINVHIALRGDNVAAMPIELLLDRVEVDDGFVVPRRVAGITDDAGLAVLAVWPNARGSRASRYRVRIGHAQRTPLIEGEAVFPADAGDVDLHAYLQTEPYAPRPAVFDAVVGAATRSAQRAAEDAAAAVRSGAVGVVLRAPAGGLGGHRVIAAAAAADGTATLADVFDRDTAFSIAGISRGATAAGAVVELAVSGATIDFEGWAWRANRPVFLGRDGTLTQQPNDGLFIAPIGTAITPRRVLVSIHQPTFIQQAIA